MAAPCPDRAPSSYERRDTSWVLEAIEKEALVRARAAIITEHAPPGPLTREQIVWMIWDYRARTGLEPRDIDPAVPYGQPQVLRI